MRSAAVIVIRPPADPNAPGPGPGIPKNVNFQILSFMGEYAVNRRFSAFVEIPFRWIQPQGVSPGSPSPRSQPFPMVLELVTCRQD